MPKNTLNAASDHFWYSRGQWIECDSTPEHRQLSNEAFTAGARWSLRETSRLSPHIAQFTEMLILLGMFDDQLETAANAPDSAQASERAPGSQDDVSDR